MSDPVVKPDAVNRSGDEATDRKPTSVLRSLAPLLRGLERQLRAWLDSPRRYPLAMLQRAELIGLADDLRRQADALDVDAPLLVVMLMGGTGVGKSTLLNALAGSPIAQAAVTRPTTRDPVVYFHHSVRTDRLDPALRLCRLVRHDRPGLEQKVIVDTPDLDSNDVANREKLQALLPVADIVLYIGSQEKYHDRLGWELFKQHRSRRGFAFVLNKWDRCVTGEAGLRPDEDLLRDLRQEGFSDPLLFRTSAQLWVDAAGRSDRWPPPPPPDRPEGEQFELLRNWLELGLTRLEIEAVKARGVEKLLDNLYRALEAARPPELDREAERVAKAWEGVLSEEAVTQADVLLGTLEPYQTEIEHHFSVQDLGRFRGMMAAYLHVTTRLRYARSNLRDRIPFANRLLPASRVETPVEWNLGRFVQECSRAAGERVLDQRISSLVNRLLVEAEQRGFPLVLLNDSTHAAGRVDWRERVTRAVIEALSEVEREAAHPTGWRRLLRGVLTATANTVPEMSLVVTAAILLYRFIVEQITPTLFEMLLIGLVPLTVAVMFQILIVLLLPVRWASIRARFQERLGERLAEELQQLYLPIPTDTAAMIRQERERVDQLRAEVRQVIVFLAERQTAASVAGLYGRSEG